MAKKSENIVFQGTGRRKESIARVRLMAGKGEITVNGRKLDEQVTNEEGKIIWNRLPVGEYQVRELKTLEGYILNSEKEKISIEENQTLLLEKVNVPLLPNTSGKEYSFQFLFGLVGLFISKQLLR